MKIGQIVISKAGKDKGLPFVIIALCTAGAGEYVFIADGKSRKLENPKRKKWKHLQPTNHVVAANWEKDADIKKAITLWQNGGNLHG